MGSGATWTVHCEDLDGDEWGEGGGTYWLNVETKQGGLVGLGDGDLLADGEERWVEAHVREQTEAAPARVHPANLQFALQRRTLGQGHMNRGGVPRAGWARCSQPAEEDSESPTEDPSTLRCASHYEPPPSGVEESIFKRFRHARLASKITVSMSAHCSRPQLTRTARSRSLSTNAMTLTASSS